MTLSIYGKRRDMGSGEKLEPRILLSSQDRGKGKGRGRAGAGARARAKIKQGKGRGR